MTSAFKEIKEDINQFVIDKLSSGVDIGTYDEEHNCYHVDYGKYNLTIWLNKCRGRDLTVAIRLDCQRIDGLNIYCGWWYNRKLYRAMKQRLYEIKNEEYNQQIKKMVDALPDKGRTQKLKRILK